MGMLKKLSEKIFISAVKKQEDELQEGKQVIDMRKEQQEAKGTWEIAWRAYRVAAGINESLTLPPVHASHMPYGFTIFGFRQLRQAIWNRSPIFIDVPLKAGVHSRLQFEVEFRPTLWEANVAARKFFVERPNTPTREDVHNVHIA